MLFAFFYIITNNKSNNLQLKFFIFFIRTVVYNEQIMIKNFNFLKINLIINQKIIHFLYYISYFIKLNLIKLRNNFVFDLRFYRFRILIIFVFNK